MYDMLFFSRDTSCVDVVFLVSPHTKQWRESRGRRSRTVRFGLAGHLRVPFSALRAPPCIPAVAILIHPWPCHKTTWNLTSSSPWGFSSILLPAPIPEMERGSSGNLFL